MRPTTMSCSRTFAERPVTGEGIFMINWRDELVSRTADYCAKYKCEIETELGFGYDGIVFSTTCQSAIKVLRYQALYQKERDVYLRLQNHEILTVSGFHVPELLQYDDELWVIEMRIVRPPFVLDFAGAYLDEPPDFPEEIMAEWRAEKKE